MASRRFLDPSESEHDAFGAGHACTAISAGLGLLTAKRVQGQPGEVVCVVGDGALTGGLSFEGLNNVGRAPLRIIVNDNGMSISPNVGAIGQLLPTQARRFFEALGFAYFGPVDGHDLAALISVLTLARQSAGPVVVHVRTQKGRGFAPAEADLATRGHAMGPYEVRDGKLVRSRQGLPTFSEAFASALEHRMAADPHVVAITPAMLEGSALVGLKTRFPDRVFDVGIAEQHAVTFAAGLAHAGAKPVVCIYSTFLQRAYDSVMHDVALARERVVFAVDRAGLVGADGATHQGSHDVAFLRNLPGFAVLAAVGGDDLGHMLNAALAWRGPAAIRFPRGTLPAAAVPEFERIGAARWLRRVSTPAVTFVTSGPLGLTALEAAEENATWGVLDVATVSPLDEAALLAAARHSALVVVEEGTVEGGLGSAVLELLARHDVRTRVQVLGLPRDRFVRHGEARTQRAALGLDVEGLQRAARSVMAP